MQIVVFYQQHMMVQCNLSQWGDEAGLWMEGAGLRMVGGPVSGHSALQSDQS